MANLTTVSHKGKMVWMRFEHLMGWGTVAADIWETWSNRNIALAAVFW